MKAEFDMRPQYKVTKTEIHEGKSLFISGDKEQYYSRFVTICTPYGYVTAMVHDWESNNPHDPFTLYQCIVNGYKYSGFHNSAPLTDSRIKLLANKFIKLVLSKINTTTP